MRPLKLNIEGLRSFRAPVTIDFADRNQLAIVGDTGAGKSSILDAITYALYRQTTFSKQPNQELMNASATQMRVVLRFCVSGETWIVTRALKRVRDGVTAPQPELSRVDEHDKKLETVAGAGGVGERIRSLIGLDGDAFLRTVVLPQGNFARLLIADGPTERATVLRQVWRTDELEEAGKIAAQKATEVQALRTHLQVAAAKYPDDPDQHLRSLRKDRNATRKKARKAKDRLDAVAAAVNDLDAAGREIQLCQAALHGLRGADVAALGDTLDDIEKRAGGLAQEHGKLVQALAAVDAKMQRLDQDDDGPPLAEVVKAIVRLDAIESSIGEIREVADKLHGLSKAKGVADEQATKARQVEADCQRQVAEHDKRRGPLHDVLEKANALRADVAVQWGACEKSESALAAARTTLTEHRQAVDAYGKHFARLKDNAEASEREREEAEQKLAAARQADCAASAADGLYAGDDCPICSRALPGDWQAPASPDVDEAATEAQESKATSIAATKRAGDALGKLKEARGAYKTQEQVVEDDEKQLATEMAALRKLMPSLGNELPEKETVLHPLDKNLDRAKADLDRHDTEQVQREETLSRAKLDVVAASERTKAALKELSDGEQSFGATREAIEQQLERMPEQFRPAVHVPDDWAEAIATATDDLVAKRESAKARQAELEATAKQRQELAEQKDELTRRQDELKRKYDKDVAGPVRNLVTKANNQLAAMALEVGKLRMQQPLPSALTIALTNIGSGLEATKDIRSSLLDLEGALGAVRDAATKRIEAATGRHQKANAKLAKFANQFDVPEDDAEAIASAANKASDEAGREAKNADKAFEKFSAIVDSARDLRKVLARTEAKERALNDLAAALKPGAFLKWLTLRRSRSLLSHASVVLKQMSGDRYAFADPDDADSPWQVLDNDTGQARSPASLSGGEQFIASLALALGMVEMMARSGGRLESLFLDEGFGSLDRHNLDSAVEALAMVAARGRMVGVISHVRAVAEQFDNVLAVTREESGSRAAWLADTERQDMTADALAGLLD